MAKIPVMSKKFKHEPLDPTKSTIRVFHILPGTGTIRCLMKHVDLDSDRTACSYVWGDTEPSQLILINERPFHIRENLHDFLLQMRKDELLGPLWVDALCIDQSNTSERNHQVQQMGSIFRSARAVISWLGQGAPFAAQFMQFARIVSKEVTEKRAARAGTTKSVDSAVLFYLSVHRNLWDRRRLGIAYFTFSDWVTAFCCLEYFTRTWIEPEVFLAPAVHTAIYGDVNVAWADLNHTILTFLKLLSKDELYWSPVGAFVQTPIPYPHAADPSSVFALIVKFAKTKCSDPRDHVFALQSLWDNDTFPIGVDYNLSSFALFFKLASWLLTPAIQPLSSFITLIELLELEPEDFANGGEQFEANEYIPITLSAAWSREINMRELSKSRVEKHSFPGRITAPGFHFCSCEHCIHLHDWPETTLLREYALCSQHHHPITSERMDEEIHLVEILGSKTNWGILEGDLQDSDPVLVITPACLNRDFGLPRVEERDGKLAIGLSLKSLCELIHHLRPDVAKRYVCDGDGHSDIDRNKHGYISNDDHAGSHGEKEIGRALWGDRKWLQEMQKQRERARNTEGEDILERTQVLHPLKQRETLMPWTPIIRKLLHKATSRHRPLAGRSSAKIRCKGI